MKNTDQEIKQVNEKDLEQEIPAGKSADIFNALSLQSEILGEMYLQEGYNPFESDFMLDEKYVKSVLDNKVNIKNSELEFLQNNNKEIMKCFEASLLVNENVLKKLKEKQNILTHINFANSIIDLKNRAKLLKYIMKKMQENQNAIDLYTHLNNSNNTLNLMFANSFSKNNVNESLEDSIVNNLVEINSQTNNTENVSVKHQTKTPPTLPKTKQSQKSQENNIEGATL